MPDLPLHLVNKLLVLWCPVFARISHRRVYSLISAVCAVAMAMGLVKKIQSLDFFHHLPTTDWH